MCGIIGYIGKEPAVPVLIEGLRKLEYRGYDSSGVAVLQDGVLAVRRAVGKLQNLESLLRGETLSSRIGIGHVRWATHGRPSEENAHPHRAGSVVVVHNGIIENYTALKKELAAQGRTFLSETDTEVIAHLIDSITKNGVPLDEAVRQAAARLQGAYAIAVIDERHPDMVVGARKGSPLVVGLGQGEFYLASDIPAILHRTRDVLFLNDDEMAILSDEGVRLTDFLGNAIVRDATRVLWNPVMAEKGGYRHFMLKEIYEQPRAIMDTIRGRISQETGTIHLEEIEVSPERLKALKKIFIVACGTSWHAGLVGKYMIEELAGIPTEVDIASEFRYRGPLVDKDALFIAITQSGAGVFAAASREAIERDAWLLSLISATLVLLLLLRIYRRPRIVALCFVPVASGLVVGIAAVSLVFGYVHAITLGFGATLIGEAVDYPSYACLNAGPGENPRSALARIWPTLRLAVLTTVLGGLTMLLSSFAGLAQLGLLSMSGVLVAGMVTRDVVPALAGARPVTERAFTISPFLERATLAAPRLHVLVWALAAAAVVVLVLNRDRLWEDDLAAMNPVPEALKAADRELRREIGAPDVRYLLLVRGETREAALERAEALEGKLDQLVGRKVIAGYDLATRYVPSLAEQKRRLSMLPEGPTLRRNLEQALRGLPFQRGVFEPFLRDVEASRSRGPLGASELEGTILGMKLQTLVVPAGSEWAVLVPLTGGADARALAAEVPLLDLKLESERLLAGYRLEALRLSGLGMALIVIALALGLRQARAVVQEIGR